MSRALILAVGLAALLFASCDSTPKRAAPDAGAEGGPARAVLTETEKTSRETVKARPLPGLNPTSYEFDASAAQVRSAVEATFPVLGKATADGWAFTRRETTEDGFVLWAGRRASRVYYTDEEEVLPLSANYRLRIAPSSGSRTTVTVEPENPRAVVTVQGKFMSGDAPLDTETKADFRLLVEPTTIEEYELLLKLGAALGQEGMPELLVPVE